VISRITKIITHTIPISGLFLLILLIIQSCEQREKENLLQITTDHFEYISEGLYKVTGTLISKGDYEISGHGFCWGESENPDMEGLFIQLGPLASTGQFSTTISELSAGTTYYFRAFAVTNSAPVYANEKSLLTNWDPETMIQDIDGNTYRTMQIGDQTWMAENLKVSRYPDGTRIPFVEDQQTWFHLNRESEGFCWYDNVYTNGTVYGGLYTWVSAVGMTEGSDLIPSGIQGACPDGWHLPSDGEWKQLEMHLGMSQNSADTVEWRGTDQGGKMKQEGSHYWKVPNQGATNESGFNALGGGYRHGSGEFIGQGTTARFWSATGRGYGYSWFREFDYDKASVFRDFIGVYRGHSIRCVKDE